jgi:precorrin-8X/cobalt-precorrin-8 methylmutase
MSASSQATAAGVLIVGHGSPRANANAGFIGLVERVAGRLSGLTVLPTFFSIAHPNIEDRVAELAARGVRRIVLMPYFLYSGQHVTADIPALLDRCRATFPGVSLDLLATLEGEPGLEDIVVERLAPLLPSPGQPVAPDDIEQRSFQIIDAQLGPVLPIDPTAAAIVRRVVHATADISFARSMRIHPEAASRGKAALATGRPIVCDVRMLVAGITRVRNEVLCAIDNPQVAQLAKEAKSTRAAAAMEFLADRLDGAIIAIGNAPTALWKILEIVKRGGPRPALVVGLPVGFVGAAESKQALLESDLCYITNVGPRGGSPVAAAALNAIATQLAERSESNA